MTFCVIILAIITKNQGCVQTTKVCAKYGGVHHSKFYGRGTSTSTSLAIPSEPGIPRLHPIPMTYQYIGPYQGVAQKTGVTPFYWYGSLTAGSNLHTIHFVLADSVHTPYMM